MYVYERRLAVKERRYGRKRNRFFKAAGIVLLTFGFGCVTMRAAAGGPTGPEAAVLQGQPVGGTVSMNDVSGGDVLSQETEPGHTTEPKRNDEIVVLLDPGHGGEDEGCSRQGVLEKDVNLQIGKAVRTRLLELGYQVVMTREEDKDLTLEQRVEFANQEAADIFVSIHQNASEGKDPKGVELWYYAKEAAESASGDIQGEETAGETASEERRVEESRHLAVLLNKFTQESTGAKERELCTSQNLVVLRETKMPSCLIETGFLSNPEERAKLTNPEYQDQIAAGIVSGIDLYFHPKTMYLTFDDGPSEENTSAILDILKERNIKATFFVVGENVKKHPEIAKRIAEEGHTIGIHCNWHDYNALYESVDSYLADFEEAYDTVYQVTGVEVKLFRFPGGSINAYNKDVYEDIIEEMTRRGFIYFDWNASLEDAMKKAEPEKLLENARQSTLGRKKVVMLAHDIIYNTTLCLDDLIDQFPEYQMLPLTEEVKPIQF